MKLTSYFIKHPVSAIILNATIILIGILSFYNLTIREYPEVTLPELTILASYPNASAELVESSVTNILEDQLAGVEGIDSMSSNSTYENSKITIKFRHNTSKDRSLIAVKDAISMARSKLPIEVKEPIVQTSSKNNGPPFMAACLESNSMKANELTHYVQTTLKNGFRSIKGVSSAQVWGTDYAYKITLDHHAMYNFGINADEIFESISKNVNASLPAGKFQNETPVTIITDLQTDEDMGNILIKNIPYPIFLKSLAKIELSSHTEGARIKLNGKPGVCIGINKTNDSNPLKTSELVHQHVNYIKQTLPDSIKIDVVLDQAKFVRSSINNIKFSVIEAILLVSVIVFLFLRNISATIIPIITIPIALLGSLFFLKFFGFSINTMTLLAMVLAVGLVVDDAIVVLENITRHIEKGETPLNSAINGAKEIGFAVIAMTLTLTSVYVPIAFISGLTGQLFIEFAVALAGSVLISGVTAISLSPLMCTKLLKTKQILLFPQIDKILEKITHNYNKVLKTIISYKKIVLGGSISLIISMAIMFNLIPSELTPKEDRGTVIVSVATPPNQTIDNIEKNVNEVEKVLKNTPESQGILTFVFPQGGMAIPLLKPIEQRKRSSAQIVTDLRPLMTSFPSFDAFPWSIDTGLPGIDIGTNSSELALMISTVDSYKNLFKEINQLAKEATDKKLFRSVDHNLNFDNLGYSININKDLMAKLKFKESQIAKNVEIFFSGIKSLDFKKDNILYPIHIKSDINPWNLDGLYLTNSDGQRISIANFTELSTKQEPSSLHHYNQMRSVKLFTNLTVNDNLEEAINKLYKFANKNLPSSYQKSWSGIAKIYNETSATMPILFFLSMLFIYAILAVQFDNFIDPLIILFTIPLACSGALLVMYLTGGTLNIYSQVGLITLIGLITKHGILIVEFANKLYTQGNNLLNATIQSSTLRLRPILMTTGAMIAGSIPLILSSNSGYEARHAIGMVLVSGLGIGTLFTLFVLPSLYFMVKSITLRKN